jgi:predicted aconitase
MRLTDDDRSMLAGELGGAAAIAMELLVAAGDAMDAPHLLDITGAHIDGCLYHGLASLDFAIKLADAGGEVRVPATLNVSSLDLLHPGLYRGDEVTATRARSLMDAYVALGCKPTWTCAPYQLPDRPGLGDQVAWGESNAIVFANSVLGARTNRYGDFLDICCALTGRAPALGLHTDEGRVPGLTVEVEVPDRWRDEDLLYVAVGHLLGAWAGTAVAFIRGLDQRADEDRLKALGAAAASSGAVAMFHVEGVTPEAGDANLGAVADVLTIDEEAVRRALHELGPSHESIGAVSIGTPHASVAELERLAGICRGRRTRIPFYVNTGRDVLAAADAAVAVIEEFGARIVTDTCTYITPILEDVDGAVMTNSGKWAYYAPGNLGVGVVMGTMLECVETAVSGRLARSGAFW